MEIWMNPREDGVEHLDITLYDVGKWNGDQVEGF